MDNQLTFNETLTVEQFKERQHVSKLEVKKNPQNGKLFFSFGAQVGGVAVKGIPTHPMVSNVTTPEGDTFWLLHEEGNGAEVIATF
jgi:hypothetical protein